MSTHRRTRIGAGFVPEGLGSGGTTGPRLLPETRALSLVEDGLRELTMVRLWTLFLHVPLPRIQKGSVRPDPRRFWVRIDGQSLLNPSKLSYHPPTRPTEISEKIVECLGSGVYGRKTESHLPLTVRISSWRFFVYVSVMIKVG